MSVAVLATVTLLGTSLVPREDSGVDGLEESEESRSDDGHSLGELYAEANAGLAAMREAVEAYYAAHGLYPVYAWHLTTPVAYLPSLIPDPFAGSAETRLDSGDAMLRLGYSEDMNELRLYSVGPDGIDSQGSLPGATRPGWDSASFGDPFGPGHWVAGLDDVMVRIPLTDYVLLPDVEAMDGIITQRRQVEKLAEYVKYWAAEHEHLPASWDEMFGVDKLLHVQEDLFAAGELLVYRRDLPEDWDEEVVEDNPWGAPLRFGPTGPPRAVIYGRGPNGMDDRGDPIRNGIYLEGEMPHGDIVAVVGWSDVAQLIQDRRTTANPVYQRFLAKIERLREETGRDNAMIRYEMIAPLVPYVFSTEERDLMGEVYRHGWSSDAERLVPRIEAWEPGIRLIREGAALDFAEFPPPSEGSRSPAPNYFVSQNAVRILAVKARHLLSRGEIEDALDILLVGMRYSRDFSAEGTILIGSLISVANQSVILHVLSDLVSSGDLDEDQLKRIQRELAHIAATDGGIMAGIRGEHASLLSEASMTGTVEITNEYEIERLRDLMASKDYTAHLADAPMQEIMDHLAATVVASATFYPTIFEDAAKEPHEVAYDSLGKRIEDYVADQERKGYNVTVVPIADVTTRYWVIVAWRRLVELQAALEIYRLRAGRYPDSLVDLRGWTIDELPTDPFSGEAFRYRAEDDGAAFDLYSLGPDKLDNPEAGEYDPKNGTISPGVIR